MTVFKFAFTQNIIYGLYYSSFILLWDLKGKTAFLLHLFSFCVTDLGREFQTIDHYFIKRQKAHDILLLPLHNGQ